MDDICQGERIEWKENGNKDRPLESADDQGVGGKKTGIGHGDGGSESDKKPEKYGKTENVLPCTWDV